jgi:hypothetical protein
LEEGLPSWEAFSLHDAGNARRYSSSISVGVGVTVGVGVFVGVSVLVGGTVFVATTTGVSEGRAVGVRVAVRVAVGGRGVAVRVGVRVAVGVVLRHGPILSPCRQCGITAYQGTVSVCPRWQSVIRKTGAASVGAAVLTRGIVRKAKRARTASFWRMTGLLR